MFTFIYSSTKILNLHPWLPIALTFLYMTCTCIYTHKTFLITAFIAFFCSINTPPTSSHSCATSLPLQFLPLYKRNLFAK